MNLNFSIVAEREIEAAADYYEKKEAGLGLRFVHELDHSIKFILQFPKAWSPVSKRARRCVLRRFPKLVGATLEAKAAENSPS